MSVVALSPLVDVHSEYTNPRFCNKTLCLYSEVGYYGHNFVFREIHVQIASHIIYGIDHRIVFQTITTSSLVGLKKNALLKNKPIKMLILSEDTGEDKICEHVCTLYVCLFYINNAMLLAECW